MKIARIAATILTITLGVVAFSNLRASAQTKLGNYSPTGSGIFTAGPAQGSVASKKPFGTATASAVAVALAATDLTKATALIGKTGSFQGTITSVYVPDNNKIVILDFAQDYNSALTAVVLAKDYASFPKLANISGKHVLISGKFTSYHDKPEIVLTKPDQLKLIK